MSARSVSKTICASIVDYKLDSYSKKQTTVIPKSCSALATADTPAVAFKKPSEK